MKKLNLIFLMLACLMLLGSCGGKQMETVTVHSADEFIKALKSDTHIIIDADGNLEINDAVRNSNFPSANIDNPQKGVFKQGEFDETLIISLDNIIIEGAPNKDRAHFLGRNETLDVLVFCNCNNVTVKHIKAGHAQSGECSGDVFWITGCENVAIDDCELYGCGVVGANVSKSKNVEIKNSWIYECSDSGIDIDASENVNISNNKIDYCYIPFRVFDNCKNVAFAKCNVNNNDNGGMVQIPTTFTDCEMQPLTKDGKENATLNNCKELTPTSSYRDLMDGRALAEQEDYDPEEDEEDSEEPEYLTGYTGEVDFKNVKGASVDESKLETITVHSAADFVKAIGSNRKIIIETAEWLYAADNRIELSGIENLVIEGKGEGGTHFDLMFTEGCNNVVIRNITLSSIHIGSGCSAFTIDGLDNNSEVHPDYRLRILNAENILVKNSEVWNSPTIINKSQDVEFDGCKFNQCDRYMEASDISNVWFNACTFENSPGDGESDEYGHFKLDSPVVFKSCRLKVWQDYADFSMAKLIDCPKCFADMVDWSFLYE